MSSSRVELLEEIAKKYHLNESIPDKFIEDICQDYCCQWMQKLILPTDDVIELGYGEGITLSKLSAKANSYTVIEGAPSLVEMIKNKCPDVHVINSLFEKYQPKSLFDKILALHVFEHVDSPVTLAKHISSWLKESGEMIVIVPNRESIHRRLAFAMGLIPTLDTLSERDLLVGHQRVYSLSSLVNDLSCAGFEVVEHKGFFVKPFTNQMMLPYGEKMIHALNIIGEDLPTELQANIAVRVKKRL